MAHTPLIGYRELSTEEIDLINAIKEQGNQLGVALEALADRPHIDRRWLAIGKTHMQEGLMAVIRAITKPDSF